MQTDVNSVFPRQRYTHSFVTAILSLILLLLFVSTTTFLVANLLIMLSNLYITVTESLPLCDGSAPDPLFLHSQNIFLGKGMCYMTGTLTVNVRADILTLFTISDTVILKILFGDGIVCWRASVLWPGNRVVKAVLTTLLLSTFGASTTTQ